MKRTVSILLCMALLLGLGACGENVGSSVPAPSPTTAEPVSLAEEGDYIVPASWTENSVNDGNFGYVTADAGLPEGASMDGRHLVTQDYDTENKIITLTQYALDGTEEHSVAIPMTDSENQSVGYYEFGENSLWLTFNTYTLIDEETGETEVYGQLQNWSYDGTCLTAVSIEEALDIDGNDSFISGLALDGEGDPLIIADDQLYFCASDGKPTATAELPNAESGFCRDSSGRLYVNVNLEAVYTIDWENHALGSELFSSDMGVVSPGGGEYDFLIKDSARLQGVSLQNGAITEILSWADWDLADQVGDVAWLDEDTFLITASSLLLNESQLLTFTRVPADQIPEKTTVRLAVELSQQMQEWGADWTDSVDQKVTEAINQFNRASDTYRIEVETYADSTALQLQLAAGDHPDLFYWGSGYMDDMPSLILLAKKGYLTDLEPKIEADEELDTDDFIPSIYNMAKEQAGGLYSMPLSYYFLTLAIPTEYAEPKMEKGWTVSDMLAAAQKMPEDMELFGSITQSDMLDNMLQYCASDFMDVENATCDFATQEFYDLLTLCRDYCYAEPPGENYVEPSGGTLLHGYSGMLWEELLDMLDDPGMTMVGYPNAGESGSSIVFYQQIAICALGAQPEGAWEFVRMMLGSDFQKNMRGLEYSVRNDGYDNYENWRFEYVDGFTEENAKVFREMIYGAAQYRAPDFPCSDIIQEEAAAFFAGDKTAQETAELINSRVRIYLSEQS